MTALDGFWHLLNALAAPAGLALISALLVRLLWRTASAHRSLPELFAWSFVAALTAHVAAWVHHGAEGSMLGYAGMVVSVALALWCRVFLMSAGLAVPPTGRESSRKPRRKA